MALLPRILIQPGFRRDGGNRPRAVIRLVLPYGLLILSVLLELLYGRRRIKPIAHQPITVASGPSVLLKNVRTQAPGYYLLGVNRKEGMKMTRVRVEGFTISLDGYGAGPNQDIRNPLGVGGTDLHQWLVPTRTFQRTLFGADGGTTGIDDDFAARGFKNVGAWILGRNMFGPIRGSWPDMNWKGWWGDNPPYHVPTFILTHHARPPIQMEGGTTFYFVTGGIHEALDRARDAANGMDVRIGGGPNTIQQYLRTGLIDELHVAISPVLLGGGERLFEGIDVRALGYECVQFVASEKATHVVLRRQGHNDA
jgi:dihydrofolate reductase